MYCSPFRKNARQTTVFKKLGSWSAGYHTGEDWVCDGDKTLVAPAGGTITRNSYDKSGYGNYIVILTDDGKSILMGHMVSKSNKGVGSRVYAGDIVGTMGNTGNSYGAHLHIEVQNSSTWAYNRNLLKPSDYVNFNNNESEGFEVAKTWKNGSTKETVFSCSDFTGKIGSLDPKEECQCLGVFGDAYAVLYNHGEHDKIGFVKYSGGIK